MIPAGVATFAAGLFAAVTLAGGQARPIQVTPVVTDGQVTVSFTAPEALDPETRALVQSGLLLTLSFDIDLKAPSAAWFDRTMARAEVASTIKFDNLTGVYLVSRLRDDHVIWSERTHDVAQAELWATSFDGVHVADTAGLVPNAEYYLRVRLRFSPRRTFPLWPWASDDRSGRAVFTYLR